MASDVPSMKPQDYSLTEGPASQHKGNLLVNDLVNLHCKLWLLEKDRPSPPSKDDYTALAKHIVSIIQKGSPYTLPSSVVVAESYFKGGGRFLDGETSISDDAATEHVVQLIETEMDELQKSGYGKEVAPEGGEQKEEGKEEEEETKTSGDSKRQKTNSGKAVAKEADASKEDHFVTAKPSIDDIVLLEREDVTEKTYVDHQGNSFLILELSQFFTEQYMLSNPAAKGSRADAALATIFALLGPSNEEAKTRFLVRPKGVVFAKSKKEIKETWKVLGYTDAAEFVLTLLFDKLVDKENIAAALDRPLPAGAAAADGSSNKPSMEPVKTPTSHDVLLGRGGLTNNHPGNRRFRDIILLHRPDYVRAIKIEKPNVARRIVRAIRCGDPPGRFLKRDPKNGMWYDVGDRNAAEKTSQGLREKTQAEKAARLDEDKRKRLGGGTPSQRAPRVHPVLPLLAPAELHRMVQAPFGVPQLGLAAAAAAGAVPGLASPYGIAMGLQNGVDKKGKSDKDKKKDGQGSGSDTGEDGKEKGVQQELVDADGNIVITDSDILCGRGGLTNNHLGNKRFRDIVSLHRPDYVRAAKIHKPAVARLIVRAIRNSDPPGRFLRKDDETGKWYDIGDKRAAEKASQALREKTPEERDRLKREVVNGMPLSYFSNPALFNATSAMMKGGIPGLGTVPVAAAAVAAAVANAGAAAPTAAADAKEKGDDKGDKSLTETATVEARQTEEV